MSIINGVSWTYDSATQAWENFYGMLKPFEKECVGEPHESRAGKVVGELLNSTIIITDPRKNFVQSDIRKASIQYAVGELMWYLSGSDKLVDISQFGKFWGTISDDGDTLNSAYGYRIQHKFGFDQWEHCKNLLKADPYSRQAVVHIKDADNRPTKDTPCTVALQYQIRDNKLYATTFMRSNDIWLGLPYDMFAFMNLQVKMAMELNVDLGDYTHFTGSLHLYEKDANKED